MLDDLWARYKASRRKILFWYWLAGGVAAVAYCPSWFGRWEQGPVILWIAAVAAVLMLVWQFDLSGRLWRAGRHIDALLVTGLFIPAIQLFQVYVTEHLAESRTWWIDHFGSYGIIFGSGLVLLYFAGRLEAKRTASSRHDVAGTAERVGNR